MCDVSSVLSFVSLLPSGETGLAEQEEGRCSGGDTRHSASESVLWNKRHVCIKPGPHNDRRVDSDPTPAAVWMFDSVKCSYCHLVPGGKDLGGTGGIITPPVDGGI